MPIRQDVQDAFVTLGLTPDADIAEATKAYKRLALLHHPDRNHNDPSATQRFQQIGHAWDICQKFYENPSWANRTAYDYPDDDDIELEGEDLFDFYMYMFAETLFDRYNRAKGRRYRYERFGSRAGPVGFNFPSAFFDDSRDRQDKNSARQKKEKEEYEKRKRELELEIEREEQEAKEQARKQKAEADRVLGAHECAFQAAHSGNSEKVRRLVNEFSLDVNAPRNLKTVKNQRKLDDNAQFDSLLHAAACQCDEDLFTFLLDMGANPNVLNKQQLSPFHVAIKSGNSKIVRFILEKRGKSFQDYHPSKATVSGATPLQLAIESNDKSTIELLVKHATTHDVERCWKTIELSEEVKDILRTKKGFVPPGEGLDNEQTRGISKKAQRQQELAQQKEVRMAEEARRAEINRQKKEERAARRAIMEQEKAVKEDEENRRRKAEEQRRKAEEEAERRRLEQLHREEEEATRLKAEAEAKAKRKLERDAGERAEQEAKERAQREAKERTERQAKERAKEEAKAKAEQEEKEKAEREAKERREAKTRAEQELTERTEREAKERAEREVKERSGRGTKKRLTEEERMKIQKQRLEGQRLQIERLERERKQRIGKEHLERANEIHREERERIETQTACQREEELVAQFDKVTGITEKSTVEERKKSGRPVFTDEQQREKKKARAAERREKQKTVSSAVSSQKLEPSTPIPSSSASQSNPAPRKKFKSPVDLEHMDDHQRAKYEQRMKQRAEQSARDKERHRRMVEECRTGQSESQTQSEQSEYVPLTPVSTDAGRFGNSRPTFMVPMQLSSTNPSSFTEDIQTCVVPDELFLPDPAYMALKPTGESFSQPVAVPIVNEREPSTDSGTTKAHNSVPTNSTTTTRKPYRRKFFKRPRGGIHQAAGYRQS